jgi:hypothetical protein
MTTNAYINNFTATNEQSLIEDLVIESIQMYGYDVNYCVRTLQGRDEVFNEDPRPTYNSQYPLEMYIKNVEGFEGEGDFLSKFNIQIRDEITFTVAQSRFSTEVGTPESIDRPKEGDLIYFGLTQKLYQVKFVEHEAIFYQLGDLQTYDLRCELFEYSNEELNTGLAVIDDIQENYSISVEVNNYADTYANGDVIINANTGRPVGVTNEYNNDPFGNENQEFQDRALEFIDFSEQDPFSEGGTF